MARFTRGGTAEVDSTDVEASATAPGEPQDDREDVSGQPVQAAPEVIDLTAFNAAVDALDANDPDYTAVKAAYDGLSRKGKVQATRSISTRTMIAVDADDFASAKKLSRTKKWFDSITPTSVVSTPADPTVEAVNRLAALRLAAQNLYNSELEDRVVAAVTIPNEIVQALAAKLQEIKASRKPREGGSKRHSVGDHISEVFANKDAGTWLSAQDIASETSEAYEGGKPAKNAVDTRLKSERFAIAGLSVETRDGKRGVLKG